MNELYFDKINHGVQMNLQSSNNSINELLQLQKKNKG